MITIEQFCPLFFALPNSAKLIILFVVALVGVLLWNATPWGKDKP